MMETFETPGPDAIGNVGIVSHYLDSSEISQNEGIDNDGVPVEQAFGKFQGRQLRGEVNYSDLITSKYSRRQAGFVPSQTEFELPPVSEELTLLQRFHLLQHEVKKFISDAQAQKESQQPSEANLGDLVVQMEHLYGSLLETAETLHPPPRVGGSFRGSSVDNSDQVVAAVEKAKAEGQQPITYELHYDHAVDLQEGKRSDDILKMEHRVASLERYVGSSSNVPSQSLEDSLAKLELRTKLLSESELRVVHAHITRVLSDLEKAKQSEEFLNREQMLKVDELYDMLKRSEATSSQLPHLVDRLRALRVLHERSANVTVQLDNLTEGQQNIDSLLKEDQELLQLVQSNLKESVSAMDDNIRELKGRVEEYIKRKDAF